MEKAEKKKKAVAAEQEKDQEQVRGMFKFYETPGGSLRFSFRKYKNEPIQSYTLIDGQVYTLPRAVAKHLNKNGWYPVHAYKMDEQNKPMMKIGKKVRRFGFQSLEFIDDHDIQENTSDIVTVEHIQV